MPERHIRPKIKPEAALLPGVAFSRSSISSLLEFENPGLSAESFGSAPYIKGYGSKEAEYCILWIHNHPIGVPSADSICININLGSVFWIIFDKCDVMSEHIGK